MKNYKAYFFLFLALFFSLNLACDENRIADNNPETKAYIDELIKERKEKNYNLQFDSNSPFNRDTSAKFVPLRYYEPKMGFIFKSKLKAFENPDTVSIPGTRGESRPAIIMGYLEFEKNGKVIRLMVYKSFSRTGEPYYSLWFTDRTTGKETYGVGRYLDFELNEDPDFIYTIDFNRAYNPYSAYSPQFTSPIPRVEDYLDIAIEAGEKNFH